MFATIGMLVASVVGCVAGVLFLVVRDANRTIPVAAVPPEWNAPPAPPPPPQPPPDPSLVARGRERVGSLEAWVASGEPCPIALPVPDVEVPRGDPDVLGVRPAVLPPAPFPYTRSADADRLFAAIADEISEPAMYVLQLERTAPTMTSAHLFMPGFVRARVFLRAPGVDGFACVGEATATNGEVLATGGSEERLQQIEDGLALDVDLELRFRRAAVESLHAATHTE
jgi:hypothetical protein